MRRRVIFGYTKRQQAKPLAEQSLEDFDHFFERRCRLTYVFLAYGAIGDVSTVHPDTASAIQLLECSQRGSKYKPPDVEDTSQDMDEDELQEVLSEIQKRVAEVDRRVEECGGTYCLMWSLPHGGEVHVEGSGDLVNVDQLASLLADEVLDPILDDWFRRFLGEDRKRSSGFSMA